MNNTYEFRFPNKAVFPVGEPKFDDSAMYKIFSLEREISRLRKQNKQLEDKLWYLEHKQLEDKLWYLEHKQL